MLRAQEVFFSLLWYHRHCEDARHFTSSSLISTRGPAPAARASDRAVSPRCSLANAATSSPREHNTNYSRLRAFLRTLWVIQGSPTAGRRERSRAHAAGPRAARQGTADPLSPLLPLVAAGNCRPRPARGEPGRQEASCGAGWRRAGAGVPAVPETAPTGGTAAAAAAVGSRLESCAAAGGLERRGAAQSGGRYGSGAPRGETQPAAGCQSLLPALLLVSAGHAADPR